MASVDDFFPYVQPLLSSCPNPLVRSNVLAAAIEFCRRSRVWSVLLPAVTLVQGQAAYALTVPAESRVATVLEVFGPGSGGELRGKGLDEVAQWIPGWRTELGRPWLFVRDAVDEGLQVYPLPDAGHGASLLTIAAGSSSVDHPMTAADLLAGSVSQSFAMPAAGTVVELLASVSDAGHVWSARRVMIFGTAPATVPVVRFSDDADGDGWVLPELLSGSVRLRIVLPATAVNGNTLQMTINGIGQNHVLSAGEVAAGYYELTTPAPSAGGLTVTAQVLLTGGGVSPLASATLMLGTRPAGQPVISVPSDGDGNGVVSVAEMGAATSFTVTVAPGSSARAGQTVTPRVALVPLRTAASVPDFLVERWAEEIGAGALDRLQRMANQPWTNLGEAERNHALFEKGIANARIALEHGRVAGSLAVAPRRFGAMG